ncbi:MAG TPA: DUF72 domain-containing protein [Gemmatimonadaceae bacterium]|nr:DUF72 domain-containing protein [Gemmatimonadaceae bacterium]
MNAGFDPGIEQARARADSVSAPRPGPLRLPSGHEIRVGTAGWTDATLTAAGVFYPVDATTPEARLRYYASRFALVEVDAGFYALPTPQMAGRWIERTSDGFTFDLKAHALMTGHPTAPSRLPAELRARLAPEQAAARSLAARDVAHDVIDEVWNRFADAARTLDQAGRLGAILLQYPPWFAPTRHNLDRVLDAAPRLDGLPVSVEFRHAGWYAPRVIDRLLLHLRNAAVPLVIVDGPQGLPKSVPPLLEVTAPSLTVVRMHGHRADQWARRGATVLDKYRYLYSRDELGAWVPRVLDVAERSAHTHVVFNNCYANYGTTNALEFGEMLVRVVYGTAPS